MLRIGIIHEMLVLNRHPENSSMGTSRKTKYMCTNAVGSLDSRVQAHGSTLVNAVMFSVN